jgi:simple sugar transport system permease protein
VTASPVASETKPIFAATPWRERAEEALIPPLVALLVALICGDLLILSYGQSPAAVYRLLLEGTWGNAYGFGQVLYKATTLAFTGLAVSFGLRAGLFNIGGESQLAAGGFAAALTGLVLPGGTPLAIALILCMIAAGAAGGVVAVPAYLKTRFGAHEVIVTIMLNFIVLALLNWFIAGHMHVPETLHTPEIHAGVLPRLADINPRFHGSAANLALVVAVLVAAAVWFYLFRARGGYELRAVGLQPEAAEYGGISVGRVWMKALTFSGVIAGMGGINYVLGYKHYYEDGFASGAGFLGIAVALVGRNHPFGVLIAAFFFATLSQGGLAIHAFVPKQMMDVLQGVVIIAVATSVPEVRRVLRSAHRRSDA